MEALSDFVKNAGLFTLLHLLVTVVFVVIAIRWRFSAQPRSTMGWWLAIGIVPAVSGILLWYIRNRTLDTAISLMSDLIPEDVSGIRREARVNLLFGLGGTTVILLLRSWRQKLNRKSV